MKSKTQNKGDFPNFNFTTKQYKYRGEVINYIDEGSGNPIVLLHGNPTWSFLYRKMIPILAKKYRVIAPDLLGFGLSTKPQNFRFYTFKNHVLSISNLLEHLKLGDVVVAGQDWGGPIISTYAIEHKPKIKSIILMNTYLPGTKLRVPFYFNLLFRQFYSRLLIQDFDLFRKLTFKFGFFTKLSEGVKKAYFFPHKEKANRISIVAFPRLIPTNQNHETYKYLQKIDKELINWPVPKLLIFSSKDITFKAKTAQKLSQRLPNASFILIEKAGHFLQEDKGEEIATRIVSYLRKLPY